MASKASKALRTSVPCTCLGLCTANKASKALRTVFVSLQMSAKPFGLQVMLSSDGSVSLVVFLGFLILGTGPKVPCTPVER